MFQVESAQDHGGRVQAKAQEQNEIIDAVILAKAFSPQENRVNHADPVSDYGQQEEMPVKMMVLGGKPHPERLMPGGCGASSKSQVCGATPEKRNFKRKDTKSAKVQSRSADFPGPG